MSETVCPMCNAPRLGRALRCVCNYTFEYADAPADASGGTSLTMTAVCIAAALAGGVSGYVLGAGLGRTHGVALLVCLFGGSFAVAGSVLGWTWWYRDARAAFLRALVGHGGARIVYGLVGGGLAGVGVRMLLSTR